MNLASVWVPNSAEMDGFFVVPAAWQKNKFTYILAHCMVMQ
jgi:hypothetical protein